MQLPIDASKAPYREKYLDETRLLAPWFEFGRSAKGVDVADENGDVFTGLSPEHAELLIKARNDFLAIVHDVLALK